MKLLPLALLPVALTVLAGCFDNPALPEDGALSAFDAAALEYLGATMSPGASIEAHAHGRGPNHFPLAVGNRWAYRRLTAIELFVEGEEDSLEMIRGRVAERMTGTVEAFGRSYVLSEREIDEGENYGIHHEQVLYRQDRDGLYEAEILDVDQDSARGQRLLDGWRERASGSERAPAMLAALGQIEQKLAFMDWVRGPAKELLEGEIQRLAYPLARGHSWSIRADASFAATVEGVQRLRTRTQSFVAWRIRVDSVFFGPEDRAYLFVGREGILGHAFRAEGILTDEGGSPIGTMRWRERELLRSYSLVAP